MELGCTLMTRRLAFGVASTRCAQPRLRDFDRFLGPCLPTELHQAPH
jgi:hypothetical protein